MADQWPSTRCAGAGAEERPIVFGDNDKPGVMLARRVAYVNRYGVAPGRRAVVFTNNDDGLPHRRPTCGRRDRGRRHHRRPPAPARRAQGAAEGACAPSSRLRDRARRRQAVTGVEVRDAAARSSASMPTSSRCPAAGTRLHLTCHLGGKPQCREALAALVRAVAAGMSVAGAAKGLRWPCRLSGRGPPRQARRRLRAVSSPPRKSFRRCRRRRRKPVWQVAKAQGQGVRRFPERRDGPRT